MDNKITIEGKEYTERKISNLNIDGVKVDGIKISPIVQKDGKPLNITINLDANESIQPNSFKIESIGNSEGVSLNTVEIKESKSWISKIINFIKNIFHF